MANLRACFETAIPCAGYGCRVGRTKLLASLQRDRPWLNKKLSVAESGIVGAAWLNAEKANTQEENTLGGYSSPVPWCKQLESEQVKIVLQSSPIPLPDLPDVSLSISLAKADLGRKLIEVALHDLSAITYLYSFPPPGTPKNYVQLFRRAFMETLKDPAFLAEAKRGNLELDPVTGEEVDRIVDGLFKTDAATIKKLRELLK